MVFFDGDALLERVRSDSENSKGILPRLRTAILVTHLNETGGKLAGAMSLDRLTAAFDRSLFSFSPWQVETTTPSIS